MSNQTPSDASQRPLPLFRRAVPWFLVALVALALGRRVSGLSEASLTLSPEESALHLAPASERAAWLATWAPGQALAEGRSGDDGTGTGPGAVPTAESRAEPTAEAALGRPLQQLGGPAFWGSHVLRLATHDPGEHGRLLVLFGFLALGLCGAGLSGGLLGSSSRSLSWLGRAAALAAACALPFVLARVRGSVEPTASEVWALASTFGGVWALELWFSGRGSSWSLFGFGLAVHTVLLSSPVIIAHDVVVGLLLGAIALGWANRFGASAGGHEPRRVRSALGAALFAAVSVAPVFVDMYRDHGLEHTRGELKAESLAAAEQLPLIVPMARATAANRSDGWTVDFSEAGGEPIELDQERIDQVSFRLPKVREDKVLVLPIRYHPKWRASFRGMVVHPLQVNEHYLGVHVQDRVWEVDVSYVPFSPLVLFSQLLLACLGLLWVGKRLVGRRRPR